MLTSWCPKSARLHGESQRRTTPAKALTNSSPVGLLYSYRLGRPKVRDSNPCGRSTSFENLVSSQEPISASNSGRGNPFNNAGTEFGGSGWPLVEYLSLRDNAVTLFWAAHLVLWAIGTGRQLFGVFANFIQTDWLGDIGVKTCGDSQFAISQHRASSNRYGG
jgi:hypothetical protein